MTIHLGDCVTVMRTMPADSVDAVVTDPPAAIGFMSKSWDRDKGGRTEWVAWMTEVMRECYRVLKPGGYAVVWSLPRTCHWTGWAMEDAGFYITDQLAHVFASGFPKGRTQLKPAREDWWLARKPGPLRPLGIDAARIEYVSEADKPTQEEWNRAGSSGQPGANGYAGQFSKGMKDAYAEGKIPVPSGRWPSNVLLSDPELFDEPNPEVVGSGATTTTSQPGTTARVPKFDGEVYNESTTPQIEWGYGDTGGYSRFFSLSVRMDGCQYCGVPAAESTSEGSSTAATPSDSTPENVKTNGNDGTGSPVPSAASGSSDSITPTAPHHAQLWDDAASESSSEHQHTSGSESESSSASEPTTKPIPRSKRPAISPRSESRSDPAMSAEVPVTSSVTTTTTPSRWTCDACAVLVTRASTLAEMSTGPEGYPEAPAERPDSPRYFIVPKSSRADREPVVRGQLDAREVAERNGYASLPDPRMDHEQNRGARENGHPTVKPTDLMRHLIRLVTPPGGTVLDCFAGSGSTLIAAELEGFPWIGIEQDPSYVAIAEARLNGTQRGMGLDVELRQPTPKTIGQQGPWTEAYSGYSQGWGRQKRTDDEGPVA